jgi:hypothetical protein
VVETTLSASATVLSTVATCAANQPATSTLTCAPGLNIISGGYAKPAVADNIITQSQQDGTDKWVVQMTNKDSAQAVFTAFGLCARLS